MMNDTQYEVHPEIAKSMPPVPEEVEQVVEQQAAEQPKPEPIKEQPKQDHENFAALRTAWKRAEKERDEALRKLQAQEQQKQPQFTQQQQQEEEVNIGDNDLAEGKHLKAYNQKIKKLEEQLRLQQQQSYSEISKAKLRSRFPDFDSVVNQDTIDMLNVLQPEIAQTLNSSSDLYATGVTAYTMIKNLGIQPPENYRQETEQIKKNMAKPRTVTSIAPQQGDSPLSNANIFANGLNEELKKQLYKETIKYARNS